MLRPFLNGRPFLLISQSPRQRRGETTMPSLKQAYSRIRSAFMALVLGTMLVAVVAQITESVVPRPDAIHVGGVVVGIGATVVLIVFALVFLSGTANWSMAKGRPGSLGVMLGLLGPLGLIILVFLNDGSRRRD